MKAGLLRSVFALSSLAVSMAQGEQLCPDDGFVLADENYKAFECIFLDNPDSCKGCNIATGFDPKSMDELSCSWIEEQVCPAVRCCDACWEKSQNFAQCSIVEPNWQRNLGLIKDGCVIDCSRFPIGGSEPAEPSVEETQPAEPSAEEPLPEDNSSDEEDGESGEGDTESKSGALDSTTCSPLGTIIMMSLLILQ